jgi:Zn-dependent protease
VEQQTTWIPPAPPTPAPESPFGGEPPQPQGSPFEERKSLAKRAGGVLVAIGALLAKFKGVLLLLPKIKLLTTSASMLVSIAAYSLIFGWTFAVGFVLLLLVHEMGHVIQLRREGIEASAPLFIPFLGAVVGAKSLGDNALAEARVGLAGPILGSLGAAALIPVWLATGNVFWEALAFTGFFLNLFNLIPVSPFDGGRAMAAMAPWMWFVGLAALVAMLVFFPNPFILLFLLLGAFDVRRRWKRRKEGGPEQDAYYRVRSRDRFLVGLVYVGLAVGLFVAMNATHVVRTFADA